MKINCRAVYAILHWKKKKKKYLLKVCKTMLGRGKNITKIDLLRATL